MHLAHSAVHRLHLVTLQETSKFCNGARITYRSQRTVAVSGYVWISSQIREVRRLTRHVSVLRDVMCVTLWRLALKWISWGTYPRRWHPSVAWLHTASRDTHSPLNLAGHTDHRAENENLCDEMRCATSAKTVPAVVIKFTKVSFQILAKRVMGESVKLSFKFPGLRRGLRANT